jgi:Domain of unknown function (DUF4126)
METLPYVLTSGWASGLNVYATVLVTGLLGRWGGVDGVPDALEQTEVLLAAATLFAVEFVADKIPYLDNVWDAVHTAIRPTLAAVIGALLAGEANDLNSAVAAVLGGGTAIASHGAKAGLRLAVNASPDPFSNIVLSVAEDSAVVGVLLLAVDYPWVALTIALVLLVTASTLAVLVLRKIRQVWRRLTQRPVADPGGAAGVGRSPPGI